MKKIVIIPDSFKGSLTSIEVCDAIEAGVRRAFGAPNSNLAGNLAGAGDFAGNLAGAGAADFAAAAKIFDADGEEIIIKKIPIADGGEGTVECVLAASGGKFCHVKVRGPLGEPVVAKYGILTDGADRANGTNLNLNNKTNSNLTDVTGANLNLNNTPNSNSSRANGTNSNLTARAAAPTTAPTPAPKIRAVIEMAEASGLTLASEKNPLKASTYGTGELIKDAIERGAREILIGIGGSATNDCGIGMAAALGYRFLDADGRELEACGENMIKIASIDDSGVDSRIFDVEINVACDVTNPLYGKDGATAIYGAQKGVTAQNFALLDDGLKNVARLVREKYGARIAASVGAGGAGGANSNFGAGGANSNLDGTGNGASETSATNLTAGIDTVAGAGAAGGLGGGLIAFCGARLKSGIDAVLDIVGFEREAAGAALIITGEGAIDGQTTKGKVPVGVARRAAGVPVVAVVGAARDGAEGVFALGVVSFAPAVKRAMSLEEAMQDAHELVAQAAERAMRMILVKF